jgi:phosphoenolpyruvate synthase/pyruvate phosphate dikinase
MDNIVTLNEAAALGADQTGGKAATLGALAGDHNVPQGFVVTTHAFIDHFERIGFDFEATPSKVPDADTLARLRATPLDGELARAVHAAFGALPATDGRRPVCAVRSSAVGEDGAALSFAGQHATYYYV